MTAKRRILKIEFNWFATPDGESFTVRNYLESYGEGKQVLDIAEHLPEGEGDRLYYDIYYYNKTKERVFNPNRVIFSE